MSPEEELQGLGTEPAVIQGEGYYDGATFTIDSTRPVTVFLAVDIAPDGSSAEWAVHYLENADPITVAEILDHVSNRLFEEAMRNGMD